MKYFTDTYASVNEHGNEIEQSETVAKYAAVLSENPQITQTQAAELQKLL